MKSMRFRWCARVPARVSPPCPQPIGLVLSTVSAHDITLENESLPAVRSNGSGRIPGWRIRRAGT